MIFISTAVEWLMLTSPFVVHSLPFQLMTLLILLLVREITGVTLMVNWAKYDSCSVGPNGNK